MGVYVLALGLMLGIPLAPLAALWAMLTDLIPQVGGFLGGSFLVLLAATQGVTPAIIAGVAFVLYMNLENHVIQPAIVGRSVDLTPPTTMVAAFVGCAIAGVPGALVATPFVGAAKAIYLEARGRAKPDDDRSGGILGGCGSCSTVATERCRTAWVPADLVATLPQPVGPDSSVGRATHS